MLSAKLSLSPNEILCSTDLSEFYKLGHVNCSQFFDGGHDISWVDFVEGNAVRRVRLRLFCDGQVTSRRCTLTHMHAAKPNAAIANPYIVFNILYFLFSFRSVFIVVCCNSFLSATVELPD
jgi:hypothetical protein